MAANYINLRVILDKLLRHPLLSDLSLEAAVDYTIDFMRIVGAPLTFIEKTQLIEIKNYRGILPCDWYSTIQVKDTRSCRCLRSSTDSFVTSEQHTPTVDHTFYIQGNLIYTTIKDGVLEMAYRAILLDDEGLPLLPDNSKFTRALELYIKKQWFTILFDLGKISPASLQNTQQEYYFAVGAYQTDAIKPDLSQMESISNSWRTLLVRDEFKKGFANDGAKEILRVKR